MTNATFRKRQAGIQMGNVAIRVGIVVVSLIGILGDHNDLAAQEVRKTLNDYRRERVFQYQPSDPWTRSKLFQTHTKHYGLFYNCDNEECKRQSPHICWKEHFEKDFPTWMTWRQRIRHEVGQVRQRIWDGSCADCESSYAGGECPCDACVAKAEAHAGDTRFAKTKAGDAGFDENRVATKLIDPKRFVVKPRVDGTTRETRQGLVDMPLRSKMAQEPVTTRQPISSTASAPGSLLDRVRNIRR